MPPASPNGGAGGGSHERAATMNPSRTMEAMKEQQARSEDSAIEAVLPKIIMLQAYELDLRK